MRCIDIAVKTCATRGSAVRGAGALGVVEHRTKYAAIGESDCMTLKFVKPVNP